MGWKTLTTLALTACLAAAATPAHAEDGVTELVKPGTHSGVECYAGWSQWTRTATLLCDDGWANARIVLQINEDDTIWEPYGGYYRSNLFAGEGLQQHFLLPIGDSIKLRVVWAVRDGDPKNGGVDGKFVMPLI